MMKPRREFKPYQRDIYYADEMDSYLYHIEGKLKAIREFCEGEKAFNIYAHHWSVAKEVLKILDGEE